MFSFKKINFAIIVFLSFSKLSFSSGNAGGSGGKSAGQVGTSETKFEGNINKAQNQKLVDLKGEDKKFDHSHKALEIILQKNVVLSKNKVASTINYKGVDQLALKNYVDKSLKVSKQSVDSWSKHRQLAFYFNLYNALTVDYILKNYPLKSIKDLGSGFPLFQSAWKRKFFSLFGKLSHLDRIEHELVRGNNKLEDPLVHFAFNCASIGCPALLNEAFTASKLEKQLQGATKMFLKDRTRNYLKGKTLYVSSIFKWYRKDFEKGLRGYKSLKDFFYDYRESLAENNEQFKIVESKDYKIKFLDYDWNLNDSNTK